jgi:putative tricarboxylic transport membrane protein
MNRGAMPTGPVFFEMVLGPLLEDNVRRTPILYGNWSAFVERPISRASIRLSLCRPCFMSGA